MRRRVFAVAPAKGRAAQECVPVRRVCRRRDADQAHREMTPVTRLRVRRTRPSTALRTPTMRTQRQHAQMHGAKRAVKWRIRPGSQVILKPGSAVLRCATPSIASIR